MTGLHLAAYFGLHKATRELLNRVDINMKDGGNRTPLSWAAEKGQEAVAQLLLNEGTEVDAMDSNGCTPL
jgi:ankyrin repeat protein